MHKFGLIERDFKSGRELKLEQKLKTKMEKAGDPFVDPFYLFGHGIKSYFLLLKALILIFALISLLFIPVFVFYRKGGAFEGQSGYALNSWTLGNLGHAHGRCFHQFIEFDRLFTHKCSVGKITDLLFLGLIPSEDKAHENHEEAEEVETLHAYDYCGDPNHIDLVS